MSKVIKHLLVKGLSTLAEKNDLMSNLQFGFCKGLGVCDSLLTVTNFVQKALDASCEVYMIGFDNSASLDHVYGEAFIFKHKEFGAGGSMSNLVVFLITSKTIAAVFPLGWYEKLYLLFIF